MEAKTNVNKTFASQIAFPTIILTIVCLLSYAASIALAVKGMIPMYAAVIANTILAYLVIYVYA